MNCRKCHATLHDCRVCNGGRASGIFGNLTSRASATPTGSCAGDTAAIGSYMRAMSVTGLR